MIHVCYALYDKNGKFSKNIGTSMLSMFENTREWITVHLLHDNTLTEANRAKFIELVRNYGNYICFYNMDKLDLPAMDIIRRHGAKVRHSPATFYRLLVGKILPPDVKRLIYLDGDIIVNLDIKELWEEELAEAPLGAVSEDALTYHHMVPKEIIKDGTVRKERYFCAGVLLIDIRKFCQVNNLTKKGLAMLEKHPEYDCNDQDILNYFFAETYRPLPVRYDIFADAERLVGHTELVPAIYHYAGSAIDAYRGDIYDQLWSKYYIKTPWYDSALFHAVCRSSAGSVANIIQSFWRFLRGRTLTIVGRDEELSSLQEFFVLQNGDRVFSLYATPQHIKLQELLDDMEEHLKIQNSPRNIYVFFSPHYTQFRPQIVAAGYQEGKDFVDATWLLRMVSKQYPCGREVWKNA